MSWPWPKVTLQGQGHIDVTLKWNKEKFIHDDFCINSLQNGNGSTFQIHTPLNKMKYIYWTRFLDLL